MAGNAAGSIEEDNEKLAICLTTLVMWFPSGIWKELSDDHRRNGEKESVFSYLFLQRTPYFFPRNASAITMMKAKVALPTRRWCKAVSTEAFVRDVGGGIRRRRAHRSMVTISE